MRIAFGTLMLLTATLSSYADGPTTVPTSMPATLAILEPLVGHEFKTDAQWAGGEPLHAREAYSWGVGKKFIVAKTFVTKDDGTEYQRYETTFGVEDGRLTAYAFSADGTFHKTPMTIVGRTITLEDARDQVIVRQAIDLSTPGQYGWKVWIKPAAGGEWTPIMDGVWKRT